MLTKDGKWKPAIDPIHFDKKSAGVGPAKSFALELVNTDTNLIIGLIPSACGGSPISTWEPSGYHDQTNSYPFDDAITRTRQAMEYGILKGILWHQGESDCNPNDAEQYYNRLMTLIKKFRKDLKDENLPFIIGQLGKFSKKPWNESKKIINDAHFSLSKEMRNVSFVTSDSLTSKSDNIHFDTKSQRIFGKRYAKAYLNLF